MPIADSNRAHENRSSHCVTQTNWRNKSNVPQYPNNVQKLEFSHLLIKRKMGYIDVGIRTPDACKNTIRINAKRGAQK